MRKHRRQHLTIKLWIVGDGQKALPSRNRHHAHQINLATYRVASAGLIESSNHKDFAIEDQQTVCCLVCLRHRATHIT